MALDEGGAPQQPEGVLEGIVAALELAVRGAAIVHFSQDLSVHKPRAVEMIT